MEAQQQIGAQALLQLGSKSERARKEREREREAHERQREEHDEERDTRDAAPAAHEPIDVAGLAAADAAGMDADEDSKNQQLNDAVEAAVMRYVGGTLERKKRRPVDDLMEFGPWTGFLAEEMEGEGGESHAGEGHTAPLGGAAGAAGAGEADYDAYGRRRRRKRTHDANVDPDLTGMDSLEHDELVQAAILDARELAKHLGNGGLLQEHDLMAAHNSLHALAPHQAQQVLAAATAAVNHESPKRRRKSAAEAPAPSKFDHLTLLEALVVELAALACLWYNLLPQPSNSGPRAFLPEEIAAVEHFISGYGHLHKVTRQDVCNRIWLSERKKDNFWELLTRILPYRLRALVYKHVRRQFHVFEVRGKWTPAEDEYLRKLAATKEGNWKEIGEVMGRMPEDCRDRWRNYIKCGDNRVLNKWLEAEEDKLREIVNELLAGKKESVLNWTVVSEKMNGVRLRIQCRYKWNKLVKKKANLRTLYMDARTKLWLVRKMQSLGFATRDAVDWGYLAHLHRETRGGAAAGAGAGAGAGDAPEKLWDAADLKAAFEKMEPEVREHKKRPLAEVVAELEQLYTQHGAASGAASAGGATGGAGGAPKRATLPAPYPARLGSGQADIDDATSIANAAVAAVATVNADAQQQQYSLWR
jgi:Myb-like DNA-binding protein REB1